MGEWTKRFSLKGKHALVTGASKGIGLSVARALIADGYAVTITSRNAAEIAQAKLPTEP